MPRDSTANVEEGLRTVKQAQVPVTYVDSVKRRGNKSRFHDTLGGNGT